MKRLSLHNVCVQFGEVKALNDVSVSLEAGDVCMLVGPNGAGKSTLLKVLLGLVRPESGRIEVDGRSHLSDNSLKERLGYLPESVAFSENLSAKQVLGFFARARDVKKSRIDEVLERVGLTHAAKRKVRGYSRGMRQRLGIAVSILSTPELLILDEPTGGLDQEGLTVLWSVLEEWRAEGRLILMSTHDLTLLERRVDRMCVLRSGEKLFDGPPEELRRTTSLTHRVQMQLDLGQKEALSGFIEALKGWDGGEFVQRADELEVSLDPEELLHFLDIRGGYPELVRRLRIEEPTLDDIYEKLLENG